MITLIRCLSSGICKNRIRGKNILIKNQGMIPWIRSKNFWSAHKQPMNSYFMKSRFTPSPKAFAYFGIEAGQAAPTLILKTDKGYYSLVFSGSRPPIDFKSIETILGVSPGSSLPTETKFRILPASHQGIRRWSDFLCRPSLIKNCCSIPSFTADPGGLTER